MRNKILLFLAFLIAFIGIIPTLVSTSWGKNGVLFLINKSSLHRIEIENLSLSWFGSQTIQGLTYEQEDKKLTIKCPEVTVSNGLVHFLFKPYKIGKMVIKAPFVQVIPADAVCLVKSPYVQACSFLNTELLSFQLSDNLLDFDGTIIATEGKLEICGSKIVFDPIDITLNIDKTLHEVTLSTKATTEQANINGSLSLEAKLQQGLDMQIDCTSLPLEGLEQIIHVFAPKYSGFLLEAFGPSLNLKGMVNITNNLCEVTLDASSQNFKTSIQINSKGSSADLSKPAVCSLTLTPSFLEKSSAFFPELKFLPKQTPLFFTLTLDQFHLPFEESGPALGESAFAAKVSLQPPSSKTAPLFQLSGTVSSQRLSQDIQVALNCLLGPSSTISTTASIQNIFDKAPHITASLQAQDIVTSLLEPFMQIPLAESVGSPLSALCTFAGNKYSGKLEVKIQTPLINLSQTTFSWKNHTLSSHEPIQISYLLEPSLLKHYLGEKPFSLQNPVTVSLEISNFSFKDNLKAQIAFTIPTLNFGQNSFPALTGNLQINTLSNMSLHMQGQTLVLDSNFGLQKDVLTLISPLQIQYTVREQDLPSYPDRPKLLEDTLVKLTINPTTVSLSSDFNSLKMQSLVKIGPLHLASTSGQEITLPSTQGSFSATGPQDEIKCSFQIDVNAQTKSGIVGSCFIPKAFSCKDLSFCILDVELQNLPTNIVHFFDPSLGTIKYLLGDTVNGKLHYDKNPKLQSLGIDVKTPLLQIAGKISIEPEQIKLAGGPLSMQYLLTPEGYKILTKAGNFFNLSEPTSFSGKISELSMPSSYDSLSSFITKMQVKAVLDNASATFKRENSSEKLVAANSKIVLQKLASEKTLHFDCSTETQGSSQTKGSLDANFVITPIENTEEKSFSVAVNAHIQASKLPPSILDILCQQKKDFFSTLLGGPLDATVDLSTQTDSGSFSCDLTAPQAKLHCLGKIQNGNLQLLDTAQMSLVLSEETSKLFLEKANPLSLSALYASKPITISISPSGFSFPLQPIALNKIEIPSMRINLGKIHCKNEGSLHTALKALKYKQADKKDLEIWFAPLDLHVKQGIIDIERTEFLAAKALDFALWGSIDLPQSYLDMILGITASALRETLGIKNLPDDYVLKIPLKGPLNNVELKSGNATTKVAALLLWQSDTLGNALGPFGGVLKKVVPPPGSEGKTPPPKTPFPWQTP